MLRSGQMMAVVLLFLTVVGCQRSDRPALVPVSGTVMFSGKPLSNATVSFLPDSGLMAVGKTDSSGNFTLKTQGADGAAAGEYHVSITAMEQVKSVTTAEMEKLTDEERRKLSKSLIPARYGNPASSELMQTVAASGANQFTIELEK